MPNRVITNQDQALDTEIQISSATGANDAKFATPLKLFNWRSWFMSLINIFTNTTDSTSTSSGAVVISGGLGVMKTLFTKALSISDLAGTGSRLVSVDASGLASAPFTVTAPTVTDATIQGQITTDNNFNDAGAYSGSAIVNGIQNQFYKPSTSGNWLYLMYDSTTPLRIPIGGLVHVKGMTATPSATLGTGAGTGASGLSVSGNDIGLALTFTAGSSPVVNGNIATITFAKAYSSSIRVMLQAANGNAAAIQGGLYVQSPGTTSFTISLAGQLTAGTTYIFYLTIVS